MGIYIKGVEIPTNCTDCRYMPLVGCNPYQDNGLSPSDHRHRTCPLTEVAEPQRNIIKDGKKALSADVVQGDGRNNIKRYPNCQMRTSLGNCDAIGGFCTSINAPICDAFHKLSEAVQGEWILVKGSNGKDYHKCSKCLHTQEITGVKNYCAVCGARMKRGAE